MALSDILQTILMSQQAEAEDTGRAPAGVDWTALGKKAAQLNAKPAPKQVAKLKPRKPAPPPPKEPDAIQNIVAAPTEKPVLLPGMEPFMNVMGTVGTDEALTKAFDIMKKMNPQYNLQAPTSGASVKFQDQSIINPMALGAAKYLVENAALPGIQELRTSEKQVGDQLTKAEEELALKRALIKQNPSLGLNLQSLGDVFFKGADYKPMPDITAGPSKVAMELRDKLEKLQEKKMMGELGYFKDMFGTPSSYGIQQVPQAPVRPSSGGRVDDRVAERIGKTLEPLEKLASVHGALTNYYNVAQKLGNEAGRSFGTGPGFSNPDIETAYAPAQLLLKEARNMGASFTDGEKAILARELPSFSATSWGVSKASKLASIKAVIKVVSDSMGRLKEKAKAMYKYNPQDVENVYKGAVGNLGTLNAPGSSTTGATIPARPTIDYNKYKK